MVFGLNSVYTTHQRLMALSPAEAKEPLSETLKKAGKKALGGGVAGAVAMFVNVGTLMWMRTTVNYQYRYGMGTFEAIGHLYKEGGGGLSGIRRFYRGVGPALFQGPLSRFGDTASNAGMLALWDSLEFTKELPMWTKSVSASLAAASFRVFLMPIDAMKTILQVEGADGLQKLQAKIRKGGPGVLYAGSAGAMSATFVGHYPWFYTNNYLNSVMPKYDRTENLPMFLARNAFVGFCSSAVSDTCAPLRRAHPTPERADAPRRPRRTPLARHPTPPLSHRRAPHPAPRRCSNSIRVVKTTTQTSTEPIGYLQALKMVIEKDGVAGLFFRGLMTKIISNGCQGILFNVLWRMGQDELARREKLAAK